MREITEDHFDIIKEIINIGVGKAANILNQMLHEHVKLKVPNIKLISLDELPKQLPEFEGMTVSSINLSFKSYFAGSCQLLFSTEGAQKLVSIFTNEPIADEDEFIEIKQSVLSELGNIVLNSLIGVLSNSLSQKFVYIPPKYSEDNLDIIMEQYGEKDYIYVLIATTSFEMINTNIKGHFLLLFEMSTIDVLLDKIEIINANGKFNL